MSRIELAMEKAAKLKQVREGISQVESGPPPSPAHITSAMGRYGKLSPSNPYLVNLHDPHSPPAEEFRKLKSSLVEMTSRERFLNAVLVTSSVPNEGKSLTALNLAISLSQELDHTVLLIDADLRKPSLHRYFEIEQGTGLSDILTGSAAIGESIIATGIGKLSVMRAGASIDNPAELLSSSKMKTLMDELKKRYMDRYLIFDSAPLLPFAESRSLAHLVDGVVFVVMEGVASHTNVKDAVGSLSGTRILGVVYNAAQVDHSYASYYNR